MKTSSLRKGPGRGCDLGAGDPTPARHRKAKRPVAAPPPQHLTPPALNRYASPTGETGGPVQIYKNHIDGESVDAASGRTLDVINPATREVIARVPDSGAADVDRAVQAARRAFDRDGWPQTSARERGRVLFRLAEYVRKNGKRLAEIETTNNGKPLAEAAADVADAAFCFEYYGGLATKIRGEVLTVPDNAMTLALKEPVGVAGQIVPWNYPLMMAAQKIAPAIAAGFEAAVEGALFGVFLNQGEVCSAGSRVLVQRPIYRKLLDAMVERARRIAIGPGMRPETQMGPLVSREQHDRVLSFIETGKTE